MQEPPISQPVGITLEEAVEAITRGAMRGLEARKGESQDVKTTDSLNSVRVLVVEVKGCPGPGEGL